MIASGVRGKDSEVYSIARRVLNQIFRSMSLRFRDLCILLSVLCFVLIIWTIQNVSVATCRGLSKACRVMGKALSQTTAIFVKPTEQSLIIKRGLGWPPDIIFFFWWSVTTGLKYNEKKNLERTLSLTNYAERTLLFNKIHHYLNISCALHYY